jgi:hypothetical protein
VLLFFRFKKLYFFLSIFFSIENSVGRSVGDKNDGFILVDAIAVGMERS